MHSATEWQQLVELISQLPAASVSFVIFARLPCQTNLRECAKSPLEYLTATASRSLTLRDPSTNPIKPTDAKALNTFSFLFLLRGRGGGEWV